MQQTADWVEQSRNPTQNLDSPQGVTKCLKVRPGVGKTREKVLGMATLTSAFWASKQQNNCSGALENAKALF